MRTVFIIRDLFIKSLWFFLLQKQAESNFIQENIDNAVAQETIQTDIIEKSGKILNPRTIDKEGDSQCSEDCFHNKGFIY